MGTSRELPADLNATPRRAALRSVVLAALIVLLSIPAFESNASARASCGGDRVGDTVVDDPGGGSDAPNRPRADIVTRCIDYSDTLTYSVALAEMTDPLHDPHWNPGTITGPSLAIWLSPPNFESPPDRWVNIERVNEGLMVVVRRNDDTASVACSKSARFHDGYLYAEDVKLECLGGVPDFLYSKLTMYYDSATTSGNDHSIYAFDDAPSGQEAGDYDFSEHARHSTRPIRRLAGSTRAETSVAIAQRQFPAGADMVYLAREDTIADAVAGGSLTDGPIVLVPKCGTVSAAVRDEVARLDPGTVVALGGETAICAQTLQEASGGRPTSRLAGASRIETAAEIAGAAFPDGSTAVYLARADVLVDAVASGTLTEGPVLLVPSCGPVPEVVTEVIDALDPDSVTALGGPAAICETALEDAAGGRQAERISGADRFGTAVAISQRQWPETSQTVYLTRADVLVDAVAAGVLADGPVLLAQSCGPLRPEVTEEIVRLDPPEVIALGGPTAICPLTHNIAATAGVPYPEGGAA